MIVLMVYTWTILWFFWKLPSWLFFLNLGEILMALAYSLGTNFAESLVVLCMPLLLAVVLPKKWFYDVFVVRGASLAAAVLGCMMFLAGQFKSNQDYPSLFLKAWFLALVSVAILVLVYLSTRITFLRKSVEFIADRSTIFLYVSIPLSVVSLLAILIRSLV